MAKEKGMFEDERRELPDEPYITLSEALTWIVAGDCRGDNYVAEMRRRQGDHYQREWGSRYGPSWLLRHLELLTKGEEWQFDDAVGEEDRLSTLSQFEKAKNWLAVNGDDPAAAYKRVKDWCKREESEAESYEKCWSTVVRACASREVELLGIRYNRQTGKWQGKHRLIPHTYFLQPVFHRMGLKPEGSRWEHLAEADLTPATRSDLDDIDRAESRPTYRNVLIRRDHVERLKALFREGARAGHKQYLGEASVRITRFSQAAAERWYRREYVPRWTPATPNPSAADDLKAAREKFPGISRDIIRGLRRKYAPPKWRKRGRRPAKIPRR